MAVSIIAVVALLTHRHPLGFVQTACAAGQNALGEQERPSLPSVVEPPLAAERVEVKTGEVSPTAVPRRFIGGAVRTDSDFPGGCQPALPTSSGTRRI